MASSRVQTVRIYPRNAPAVGGISNASFTALTGRVEGLEDNWELAAVTVNRTSLAPDTTSETAYAVAKTTNITLDTGTWDVYARVSLGCRHSAYGRFNVRARIAGEEGSDYYRDVPGNSYETIFAAHIRSGLGSGTKTIACEFRGGDTGTAHAHNPTLLVWKRRTSYSEPA